MKKTNKHIAILSSIIGLLIFAISSCEIIDCEVQPCIEDDNSVVIEGENWDTLKSDAQNGIRYVLVEEFTGHTCAACPDGARELLDLDSVKGIPLVPVSLHAGSFAEPKSNADGSFASDYRTDEGEILFSTFGAGFNPAAMVSRRKEGSIYILQKAQWEAKIDEIINTSADLDINIEAVYGEDSRVLVVNASTKWINAGTGNYSIQAYLVEDHITDWQQDGADEVESYDHRHVLRKFLNGTWGEPLTDFGVGGSDTLSFGPDTLGASWKKDDCEVLVFVFDSDTYEVLQVNFVSLGGH